MHGIAACSVPCDRAHRIYVAEVTHFREFGTLRATNMCMFVCDHVLDGMKRFSSRDLIVMEAVIW